MALSAVLSPSCTNTDSISAATFGMLQKYVYANTGIVIDGTKEYLLANRLNPIVQEMKLASLDALCQLLVREPAGQAARMVVDSITTNETLFFRDIAAFHALRDAVLPKLLQLRGQRRLRIWSAAASSGQEAYSLAMLLHEMNVPAHTVEIYATDLSGQILEKAREGKYVQFEVNRGLPAALLSKYFTRSGLSWRIRDDIRQMVRFEKHDLRKPYAQGQFDLVLCRNVLIYFDNDTKRQVLENLARAMYTDRFLALGCAENITLSNLPLQRSVHQGSAFYTKTA